MRGARRAAATADAPEPGPDRASAVAPPASAGAGAPHAPTLGLDAPGRPAPCVALMSHVASCRPLHVDVLPASAAADVETPCSSRNRPCASSTRRISSRNRAMKPSRPGSSVSRTATACLTASLNSLAAMWSA